MASLLSYIHTYTLLFTVLGATSVGNEQEYGLGTGIPAGSTVATVGRPSFLNTPASGGLLFSDQKHIVYITSPFVIITDIMNSSGSYSGYGTSLFYTKEISSIIGKGFAKSHQSSFPVFITIIW